MIKMRLVNFLKAAMRLVEPKAKCEARIETYVDANGHFQSRATVVRRRK